jgi:DNA-binding protein HU-beta
MGSKVRPLLPQRKEVTLMTKAELVDEVVKASKNTNLSKKAAGEVLDIVFEAVGKAIKKDARFSFPGFGTFSVKKRAARKGRNPRTGAEIRIKASKTVGFKPAPGLKKSL